VEEHWASAQQRGAAGDEGRWLATSDARLASGVAQRLATSTEKSDSRRCLTMGFRNE